MPGGDDEVEDSAENDPAKSAPCWLLNAIKPAAPQAGTGGRIILPEGSPLRDEGNWADFYDAHANRTGYWMRRRASWRGVLSRDRCLALRLAP